MKIVIIALTFAWCGLIIGISFIEAPLKFKAPNITIELGLGIGKLVFMALARVELIIVSFIFIALLLVKPQVKIWIFYAVPVIFMLIQILFLRPALNRRTDSILAGNQLKHTYHHVSFVITEILKLTSLTLAGSIYLKSILK